MQTHQELLAAFKKHGLITLIFLFLIPLISYGFCLHVENTWSAELQSVAIERSTTPIAPETLQGLTVTAVCREPGELHDALCATMSPLWQFHWAHQVSLIALLLSILALAAILVLPAIAYRKPRLQLRMFSIGWWSLRTIGALQVLMQGVLLVWLSYWLTAYFLEVYAIKLILVVAAIAGFAMFSAVLAIFRKVEPRNDVLGEPVLEARAPRLWARIRQFADTLGTPPPRHLIAGIDANFFVSEVPMQLHSEAGQSNLQGRSLYVSLPLLRMLSQEEADAVLAHELAHFAGGDTEYSAQLGPKQVRLDHYTAQMAESGGLALVAYYMLSLFRAAFEFALQRDSRRREFLADATAAKLVSPSAVVHALIKIAGYSSYRGEVEASLFDSGEKHEGALNVSQRVAHGLMDYTRGQNFQRSVQIGNVPHPFDSHPPLQQRMQQLGCTVDVEDYADLINRPVQASWIECIDDAQALESPQWKRYEQDFSEQHELSLAFRYEPYGPEQAAVVEKYFPKVSFEMKKGQRVDITYAAISDSKSGNSIGWDRVSNVMYEDGSFGTADTLTISHPDKGALGFQKSTKLKLGIASKQRESFKEVLGRYWHRHQVMRKIAEEAARSSDSAGIQA